MNNFFYILNLLVLSFLGIGFITRFQGVLASLAGIVIVLLIPDEIKTWILVFLIVVFLLFFAFTDNTIVDKIGKDKLVFGRVLGIWLSALSPFILFTWEWALICLVIYYIYYDILKRSVIARQRCKNEKCEFLKQDIVTGILTLLTLQIIYSGAMLLPFVIMYLKK